jgi:curli biogenesis system outer membrane secretion channel CsgG
MSVVRRAAALAVGVLLIVGCAPTAEVTKGGGATIAAAQAERYDGPKARIAVGRIIDRSGDGSKKTSVTYHIGVLRRQLGASQSYDVASVVSGIRDLVTTALFQSNRYIVLEREAISDALVEQEFSVSGRVGEASRIPVGQIEGAELLVVGALTAFDSGMAGGVAFPVPIPLNKRGDAAILDLEFRKGYVAMDLRVIDVRTGRIVSTAAVEGTARKFGAGVSGVLQSQHGSTINLPVILRGFANTPVERAISDMVDAAVAHIVDKTPAEYYHDDPSGGAR